ncbi:MAG: hypothetical protein LQ352_001923 [Teloschistes flavicans]|nr:MAG: hypothetical protein LQ352_001923 [Teloschistes flavicans]
MKAVLAIEHGIIPPTVGLKTINPNIDLKDGRLQIVTESTKWPDLPIRRASINSFGYGGANAHAIIESVESILPGYRSSRQTAVCQPESTAPVGSEELVSALENIHMNGLSNGYINGHTNGHSSGPTNGTGSDYVDAPRRRQFLLPFSAHDEKTLQNNFIALGEMSASLPLADVAYTLSARRSMLTHRGFVVAEVGKSDEAFAIERIPVGKKQSTIFPTVAFIFTGQGAQWPQMGLDLMKEFPRYLQSIQSLDVYLDELHDNREWSIEGALRRPPDESSVHDAEMSQPLVTAVQIALVNLLASWGLIPSAVVGHSSGEIAAAYSAGLVTEQEAIITAYLRGKAVSRNIQDGEMMAVGTDALEVLPDLATEEGPVMVACHNSPESLTLSGDTAAVEEVKEILQRENKFARVLATGGNAYHSHHMQEVGEGYENEMHVTASRVPSRGTSTTRKNSIGLPVKFFSSVYGKQFPSKILGPHYWRENLESPVLFHEAVSEMVTIMQPEVMVEIGPHSALMAPLRQISKSMSSDTKFPEYLSAIKRNSNNVKDILELAGTFFVKGYHIDLARVNAVENDDAKNPWVGKTVIDLPHYQWQYSENILLHENRYTKEWRLRMHPRHDVLGSRIPGGSKTEPVWRNVLRSKDLAWLGDHRLAKEIVFPSTGYLAIALEAATQAIELESRSLEDIQTFNFTDVSLQNALIVPEDDLGVETLFSMRPASLNNTTRHETRFDFILTSVTSKDNQDKFVDHCRGTVNVVLAQQNHKQSDLIEECKQSRPYQKDISAPQWYESFARVGLNYGPSFQGLSSIKISESTNLAEAKIGLKPTAKIMEGESRYVIHPAALDAAMQLSILASHSGTATKFQKAFMPVAFESIKFWPRVASTTTEVASSIAKGTLKGVRGLSADLVLVGADQRQILEAKNILLIASDQNTQSLPQRNGAYTRMIWKPEFDGLDDAAVMHLYPPIPLDDNAVIPSLNNLALHQLAQFRSMNPHIFEKGTEIPHLQRLLDWTVQKLDLAKQDPNSPAKQILEHTNDHRAEEIARLSSALYPRSSESRLMCRLYENLHAIYAGEKTGIQVALQDNLLLDNYEHGQVYREGNKRLGSILDLLAHQKPRLRILEVGAGTGSATNEILPALQGHTPWRKYVEYRFTDTTTSFLASAEEKFAAYGGMTFGAFDMEKPAKEQGYEPEWDVVVASNVIHATSDIKSTLQNIRSSLKPGGKMVLLELTQSQLSAGLVLGTFSDFWKGDLDNNFPRFDGPFLSIDMWRSVLPRAGFSGLDFFLDDYAGSNRSATVICASAVEQLISIPTSITAESASLTLVYRRAPSPFLVSFGQNLQSSGLTVDMVTLGDVDNVRFHRFLFAVELESPLFLDINPLEWSGLQTCLTSATSALWVTNGSLMDGKEPLYAMISGIARGLKTENNRLRLGILDLDKRPESPDMKVLSDFEQRISDPSHRDDDNEFRRKDGITYISRLCADDILNEESRAKADQQISTQGTALKSLRTTPIQLDIDKPGVLSTLYFKPDHSFDQTLPNDSVEIEVAAAGINNKDIAVVTGRHHSDTFSDECAGTVTKVGAAVSDLQPGDRVYCQSFAKFGNFVRDKASFCQKLQPGDNFESLATMPIAFCTAVYGLFNLGQLSRNDSVLIQSATGAVGLAAVQLAKACGAEIYATVGTAEKKAVLLGMGYGIAEDHIFDSRDSFSAQAIMDHTSGRGVDVILCSARGQLMHDYWRCIASCGRFVEIGRTEVLDNGKLQLDVFRRNATFTSFDLEVMSSTRPDVISSLMSTIDKLKRGGVIKPLPYTTYHVSEIDKALMTFGKGTHVGKIVLSYDHESEPGCLGGLGRSFSKWMVQRGARKLIYLSRNGAAKPEAQIFLDSLRAQGVDAKVQKGDVLNLQDVEEAVAVSDGAIKGVIQGALTLHMWSSWTVMFGTATQSNYLASSAFMDAFARHRHAQGLPATSLALSQILGIGIVSYIPE